MAKRTNSIVLLIITLKPNEHCSFGCHHERHHHLMLATTAPLATLHRVHLWAAPPPLTPLCVLSISKTHELLLNLVVICARPSSPTRHVSLASCETKRGVGKHPSSPHPLLLCFQDLIKFNLFSWKALLHLSLGFVIVTLIFPFIQDAHFAVRRVVSKCYNFYSHCTVFLFQINRDEFILVHEIASIIFFLFPKIKINLPICGACNSLKISGRERCGGDY